MATNPSKPPNENRIHFLSTRNELSSDQILKQRSTVCSCSNISIMQLFHEMKQKFPTVPDHVVSELVTKNCHNRPACLNSLEEALIGSPVPAQAYPSQSIHNNSTSSLKRKIKNKLDSFCSSGTGSSGSDSLSSSRESSVDKKISENFLNQSQSLNSNLKQQKQTNSDMSSSSGGDNNNNNNNHNHNNNFNHDNNFIISDNYENSDNPSCNDNNRIANRPNSLPIANIGVGLQHFGRPTRTAPPPPPNVAVSPSPHDGLNVSLNVTVSPVSSRPRCLSTLQVQPEHPYSREALHNSFSHINNNTSNNNNRSSTSVNLTLRQPTNSPQSPINVIASPSPRLTYSSRTYDAKQGYESKLEIIVGDDGFRSFSAMRTQSPNRPPPSHYQMDAVANGDFNNWIPGVGGGGGGGGLVGNGQQSSLMLQEQIVSNQIEQKERLSLEVFTNKHRLKTIKMELTVLEQNLSPLDLNRIEYEILELQQECLNMDKDLYDEGDRTVNGRFLPDINLLALNDSPNPNSNTSNRPPRPPRPPPPRRQNHQPQFEQHLPPPPPYSQTFEPSIADDDANNNGAPWTCNMCTFQNHELMTRCEVCAMPKISGSTKKLTYTRPSPPPPSTTATTAPPPQSVLQNAKLLKAAPPDNDTCSPMNDLLKAINNNNEIDVPNFCMNSAANGGQPQAAGVPLNGNSN